MASERSDRLEAAIGEAARQLTRADPSGFMATRVLARLDERRTARTPWLVAAAAAVVLVAAMAAVTWLRSDRSGIDVVPPQSTHLRPPSAPSSSPPVDRTPIAASRVARPRSPAATSATRPVRRPPQVARAEPISAAEAAWRARALPPLPEPVPLALEISQPAALVTPLLELKPLETSPLVLPGIGQMPGRSGG